MRDTPYEKAVKAWPWLFVIGGYVLGVIAIIGMWDPGPQEEDPTGYLVWTIVLLGWILAYPTAIYALWQTAWLKGEENGARRERYVEDESEP